MDGERMHGESMHGERMRDDAGGGKISEALLRAATHLPEFDEVAAMYEHSDERDRAVSLREQADHVGRMALILWGVRRAMPPAPTLGVYRMTEYPNMVMADRLFVRRYNALLTNLWNEYAAAHPEHTAWSDAEFQNCAVRALRLTRAMMPRDAVHSSPRARGGYDSTRCNGG
ncbi:MAG TPA: hypothetical protein VHI13_09405 [Candidatus Kapabacteria bacterium]|nr:hypothetical protein [Candidatus Kapabacteria bacterium]